MKMVEKWDDIPIFLDLIFPIFPEVEDLHHISLSKSHLTGLANKKNGKFCHSETLTPKAATIDACMYL